MNIYLSGLMGCGKSSLGRMLAKKLGREFFDMDQEIDSHLGYSFHKLVAEKGWLPFRELEYLTCRRFAAMGEAVVGLGGGTLRYAWNRDVLAGTGKVVLLTAPLPVLVARVSAAQRPRVNPGASLEQEIERIWQEHGENYLATADMVIPTHPGGPEEIAERLLRGLDGAV